MGYRGMLVIKVLILIITLISTKLYANCVTGMIYSRLPGSSNQGCHCPVGQSMAFNLTGGKNVYFGQCVNTNTQAVSYPINLRDTSNNLITPSVWFDATDPLGNGTVPDPGATIRTWYYKNTTNNYHGFGSPYTTFNYDVRGGGPIITPAIQFGGSTGINFGTSSSPVNVFGNPAGNQWNYTIFVVFRKTTDTSQTYNLLSCYTSGSGIWNRILLGVNTSNQPVFSTPGYGGATARTLTSGSAISTASSAYNYVTIISTAGSNIAMWVNGVSQGTTSADNENENCYVFLLSSYPPSWNGSIAEVIEYNSALTSKQITQVHTYLKRKWNM